MNKAIFNTIEEYQAKLAEINAFLGYPNNRGTTTYAELNPETFEMPVDSRILPLFYNHKKWRINGEEVERYPWKHDYPLRIIVPKTLIQKYREILIFKSYFEVMGLPIEILPEEIHLYCNEILEQDAPLISQLNLVVEQKPF